MSEKGGQYFATASANFHPRQVQRFQLWAAALADPHAQIFNVLVSYVTAGEVKRLNQRKDCT